MVLMNSGRLFRSDRDRPSTKLLIPIEPYNRRHMMHLNAKSYSSIAGLWLDLLGCLLFAIGTTGVAYSQGESPEVEQESTVDDTSQAVAEQPAPTLPVPILVESAQPTSYVIAETVSQSALRNAIELGAPLAAIVIATLMIVWQMGKQHRSSLDLQRENTRAELRADIYSTLIDGINRAASAQIDASNYVRFLPVSIRTYRDQIGLGMNPLPVKERSLEIRRRHYEMTTSVIKLLGVFESYAIAVPEFGVFHDAFNSAIHDVGQAFDPLFQGTLRILPIDAPTAQDAGRTANDQVPVPAHVPAPLTDNEFQELDQLVERYLDAASDVACYIYDLRVEAQNELLSELYPNQRAPRRQPPDPRYRVIAIENAEELRTYFRDETPWGRDTQRIEEETRRNLERRATEARDPDGHT